MKCRATECACISTFLRFRHLAQTAHLVSAGLADELERMADPPVVVIASATAVPTLKVLPGVGRQIIVFADTDALRAVEAIAMHKPNLVVLQREFLATQRGACLAGQNRPRPVPRPDPRPVRGGRVRASRITTLAGRTRSGHGGTGRAPTGRLRRCPSDAPLQGASGPRDATGRVPDHARRSVAQGCPSARAEAVALQSRSSNLNRR